MSKESTIKHTIAKLVPPHMDKSWSFQMVVMNGDAPATHEFVGLFRRDPDVKAASPFLQGHSHNWSMVEFGKRDKEIVLKAAEALAKHFGVSYTEGDFTRAELGLDPA